MPDAFADPKKVTIFLLQILLLSPRRTKSMVRLKHIDKSVSNKLLDKEDEQMIKMIIIKEASNPEDHMT